MRKNDYKLLILGNFASVYIVQFVKHLKETNPNVHLYFWGYTRDKSDADRSFLSYYDEYYLFDINRKEDASLVQKTKAVLQFRRHFKTFVAGRYFDFINIHYIKPEYYFILNYFKKYASKLVLTPWGSDVYGANGYKRLMVQKIFNAADFVTGANDRFAKDFSKLFKVPDQKMVFCEIGMEPIEYIINHKKNIDVNEAKRQLGITDNYVITCGYKAQSSHQHIKIIEAIHQVKNQLPDNLLLLFPLTYPHNPDYIEEIKRKNAEYGLYAIYFEHFLEMPQLFLLRQATDMFIHVQPTDASSASLQEYILCEKKIINGSWLKYPDFIKNGVIPYFELDSMENLGQKIVDVYHSEPIKIEDSLLKEFENKTWDVAIKNWNIFFYSNMN